MAETAATATTQKGISAEDNAVLRKMFIMSHSVFMNFNMTKMEANCFTNTMAPAIEQVYVDDPEGKREAYLRHQAFFNTHAVALDFIAGLSYALEKDCAEGKVPGQTIEAIKASLMGPTAGMLTPCSSTACALSAPALPSACARRATSRVRSSSSCSTV